MSARSPGPLPRETRLLEDTASSGSGRSSLSLAPLSVAIGLLSAHPALIFSEFLLPSASSSHRPAILPHAGGRPADRPSPATVPVRAGISLRSSIPDAAFFTPILSPVNVQRPSPTSSISTCGDRPRRKSCGTRLTLMHSDVTLFGNFSPLDDSPSPAIMPVEITTGRLPTRRRRWPPTSRALTPRDRSESDP
jgi:hypothetical protein